MAFSSLAELKLHVRESGYSNARLSSSPQALKKWYRALSQRAAVCLIFAEHVELGPAVLMIQRAIHEGDPWSGQMGFPGGKHDIDDAHITATGLRELQEELAVDIALLKPFGRLSDILARPYRPMKKPMVVTPLLFETTTTDLNPSPNAEVADVLWVPLSAFKTENRQTMDWNKNGLALQLPCYHYKGKHIWGLSLMMIDELLQGHSTTV